MEILKTERLLIRQYQKEDLEAYHAAQVDPEVMRYIPRKIVSLEESRSILMGIIEANLPLGFLAIEEVQTKELIGGAKIEKTATGEYEIGYKFMRPYWGKGYATEIAKGMIYYIIQTLQTDAIIALVLPENLASIKVLLKCGFVLDSEHFNEKIQHKEFLYRWTSLD